MSQALNAIIGSCRRIHFRGKARLLNNIVPNRGAVHARIFGSSFHLDLEDFIQRQLYLGTYEPKESGIVRRHLEPGMTFVDVGANVGYYTALAAQRVGPTGRVVSFEPSPYAFGRLSSLVADNQLVQVQPVNAALGDSPGQAELFLGLRSKNHTPTLIQHEGTSRTPITVTTLDDEAQRLNLPRIDLLKIDVEGYEFKVLQGAKDLLRKKHIRAVLCEFNDFWLRQARSSSEELEQTLLDAGFVEASRSSGNDNRFYRLDSQVPAADRPI